MDIYAKNLEAIKQVDVELYLLLNKIQINKLFEVYLASGDKLINANILDQRDNTLVYNEYPKEEIYLKLEEFKEFDNYPILYFFGLGNGSFYKNLLENVKHQHLMIFEPELELIYIVLNMIDFSQDIIDTRIIIKLSSTVNKQYFLQELNNRLRFFLKLYDFHVYSNYYDKYKEEIDRVNKDIVSAFKHLIYIIGNSAADSLIGLEYSLKNIPKMITTPTLKSLGKTKNTKHAIIVSTGPSLNKQLPLLKKVQKYVSIMCIDASLPILAKEGIKPDLVFSIERVDLTAKFYKDTPKQFHKDVYFSLATVCHDETINNIHGQKCFFMRADSYNIHFGLDDWGYLGGGMSAANFAFDFSTRASYEDIIFIGQDLSYGKDGLSHSKNHVFGEDEVKSDNIIGDIDAYGGEGKVKTTVIWKAFLNAFEDQVSRSSSRCINSTEGGARIYGTQEISFSEVCKNIIDTSQEKNLIDISLPSEESIEHNLKQFKLKRLESIDIGKSMYKNSLKLFKEFDIFLTSIEQFSNKEIEEKISLKQLDKMIVKITRIKEKYNDEKFSQMYGTLLLAYVITHEFDVAKVFVMRDNTPLAKRLKKIAWIEVHSEWLHRVHTNIQAVISLVKASLKN